MSRQIQIRRGSATDHASFTGAIGEITMDTTNKTLRVHDGTTVGGTILAKKSEIPTVPNFPDSMDYVIEAQLPTVDNDYTWYRKYKSGWVEQGGYCSGSVSHKTNPLVLPIAMANGYYTITGQTFDLEGAATLMSQTSTGFCIHERVWVGSWFEHNFHGYWHVSGVMAS